MSGSSVGFKSSNQPTIKKQTESKFLGRGTTGLNYCTTLPSFCMLSCLSLTNPVGASITPLSQTVTASSTARIALVTIRLLTCLSFHLWPQISSTPFACASSLLLPKPGTSTGYQAVRQLELDKFN